MHSPALMVAAHRTFVRHAFHWAQLTPFATASAVLKAALPGAAFEVQSGWLQAGRVTARVVVRGVPVEVHLFTCGTHRSGTRPFVEVRALGATGGATFRLTGDGMPPASYEVSLPLAGAKPEARLCGAPAALVGAIAAGPLGARLAAIDAAENGYPSHLGVGLRENRHRMGADGVLLVCQGWPATPETVWLAIETAVGVLLDVQAVARQQPGGTFEGGAEMVAYDTRRREGMVTGLTLAFSLLAVVTTLVVAVGVVLARVLPRLLLG